MQQSEYDKIVVHLRIEGVHVKEQMNIEWVAMVGHETY